ncbi:hypothetical protein BDW22DRAFT_1110032 [Trametopsis cervina]|nr:hypothetical protein BDW22DRAFT_1110032 [Trametopsis cervina]
MGTSATHTGTWSGTSQEATAQLDSSNPRVDLDIQGCCSIWYTPSVSRIRPHAKSANNITSPPFRDILDSYTTRSLQRRPCRYRLSFAMQSSKVLRGMNLVRDQVLGIGYVCMHDAYRTHVILKRVGIGERLTLSEPYEKFACYVLQTQPLP